LCRNRIVTVSHYRQVSILNMPAQSGHPSPSRLSGIQALRGLAAIGVVFSHTARHLNKGVGAPGLVSFFQAGHAGVDLFFVISGFIILFVHAPDIGRPDRLSRYLSRRFTRVYPLYWLALALTIGMGSLGSHGLTQLGTGPVLWSALLLPSFHDPLLGIAWTLQREMVFYAVFALLIENRRAGATAMAAWLCLILASSLGLGTAGLAPQFGGIYGLEFFVGMAAAYLVRSGFIPAPRALAALGLALFAASMVAETIGILNGFDGAARLAYGGSGALLVAGVATAERKGRLSVPVFLQTLGGASYSIYLFQFVFIGAVWQIGLKTGLMARMPHLASFAIIAVTAVVGGILVSFAVEQPLLRLIRRRSRPVLQHA